MGRQSGLNCGVSSKIDTLMLHHTDVYPLSMQSIGGAMELSSQSWVQVIQISHEQ